MKTIKTCCFALLTLVAVSSVQASDTVDAAIGGGLGGAAGAAIGNEVGGRDGAIIGGAVGAAAGAAITTDDDRDHYRDGRRRYVEYPYDDGGHRHGGHFCPPGQAKKGNC
ncbi:glycine zipper domain-containing protein [Immundisolibacter cernigliae]|uniref:Glycine zipper domain-containing protein n=1 Tax=Immundisolibacter cernigliae TaxID=1810504 RepID=A0A1B1YR15_9GAMM|nr:glycine zipper domain-containing protein [Immundisolibacter cernigliae]ANX03201.1 hypothetical protein PG2T_02685 [Immundisolibacter cernigliae]